MGLRRLLTRQPAEDPLERLAELGRETRSAADPTRPNVRLNAHADAAPISLASVEKKVIDVFAVKAKKAVDPPRSRSGYVWVSQASRSRRAAWADFANRTF
jgi:hypothetical protein